MISALVASSVPLLLAWGLVRVMRDRSAAERHAVWAVALLLASVVPALRWSFVGRVMPTPTLVVDMPVSVVRAVASNVERPARRTPMPFVDPAELVWPLGSALLLVWLVVGRARLSRVVRRARPMSRVAGVEIAISADVRGPVLAGVLRPVILLPEGSEHWTPGRRRAVLAHELAHVRRRDPVVLALGQCAGAVFWFHPLFHLALRYLRTESEQACDDAALRLGITSTDYAGHLLALARGFHHQPAIAMAATTKLESRVQSILNPNSLRNAASRRTWLALAASALLVAGPLATIQLQAQAPAGRGDIVGTVIDPTGAFVPGASISGTNLDGSNREVTTANSAGAFAFRDIPAGRYVLEVAQPGFTRQRREVVLTGGAAAQAALRLEVGAITERVRVTAQGTPKPKAAEQSASGPPVRMRIGGNVQAAKLVKQARPVYPPDLRDQGTEGVVLLEAIVSKEGEPISLRVLNANVNPLFGAAATDAVKQWRYTPTLLNGEPVEVVTRIDIEFKLQP